MAKDASNTATREERLAAKLRENLRRRKSQARAQDRDEDDGTVETGGQAGGENEAALPKLPGKS